MKDGWYCRNCKIWLSDSRPNQCSKCSKSQLELKTFSSGGHQIDCLHSEWIDMHDDWIKSQKEMNLKKSQLKSPTNVNVNNPVNFNGKKVLIVGCGGGYDIFCGLHLFFQLDRESVILANYSFSHTELLAKGNAILSSSNLKTSENRYHDSNLCEIDASKFNLPEKYEFVKQISGGKDIPNWLLKQLGITMDVYLDGQINGTSSNGAFYFPEYYLSKALGVPVYAFNGDRGCQGIINGFRTLIKSHGIDTIVVVDGGTDSLMTGSEAELGTPHEDMLTITAIDTLRNEFRTAPVPEYLDCYLYILGYNIDLMHGVTDMSVQTAILDLILEGGFVGAYHLLNDPVSANLYYDTLMKCFPENSWIGSLVCASLKGMKGSPDWIKPFRGESRLPISPFMGLYWIFRLETVSKLKVWDMATLAQTTNDDEVSAIVQSMILES